jgi:hypothetical protein
MALVKTIVHAFALRGLSSQGALEAAQIAPADLKRVGARITALQMEWLGLGLDPQPPPRGRVREVGEAWAH